MRFDGKVVVVNGGSRGIGRATAVKFARGGADVVINYLRHRGAADEAAKLVREAGGRAHLVRADIGDPEDVKRLFAEAGEVFGGVDVIVASAAFGVLRPAMALELKHWQRTMDTMGRALLLMAQAGVPLMEGREGGNIISLTSIGSYRVLENYAAVGSAKAVLESLTRYLAVELAPKGIRVNAVSGGLVETEAVDPFANRDDMLKMGERTPLGRVGRPEDIADAVALLCTPEARWITGQVIVVDGGYSILV